MDDLGDLTSGQNAALIILAFLQMDCRNSDYRKELFSLEQDYINVTRDINCNSSWIDVQDEGDLETDGHLPVCMPLSFGDIQPSVELRRPGEHGEAAALQQVAEGLREIAAQLEHNVVAQATQNLRRNISTSPSEQWKDHLTQEVDRVMRHGVGLEHLPQERVIVALTLTLVRGVCEKAPQLLRNLFNTALQYISPVRAR